MYLNPYNLPEKSIDTSIAVTLALRLNSATDEFYFIILNL